MASVQFSGDRQDQLWPFERSVKPISKNDASSVCFAAMFQIPLLSSRQTSADFGVALVDCPNNKPVDPRAAWYLQFYSSTGVSLRDFYFAGYFIFRQHPKTWNIVMLAFSH